MAARQFVTPSEFARQALLDKLSQLGIELRSLPPVIPPVVERVG